MVSEESGKSRTFFFDFFLNPSSYPDQTSEVKLIETHASYVFITDNFVYKIKKNVNFGFLDFSTLEKRKYYTERELELNRRLCGDIYIDAIPLWKTGESLSFHKGEEVFEYALKMHRMSDDDFFLERLKNGRISESDIDEIAKTLSEFYSGQSPLREITDWGCINKLKITTDENFTQTEKFADITISDTAFKLIRYYTDEFYLKSEDLFKRRIEGGWIKNCHGDMHLEHFHKHNGRWCIFDCIEFNERFRYIDAACDIAFLLMDFDYNERNDLSLLLLEKLDRHLPDEDRIRLLDFYKCYRAYVRGKVNSIIADNVQNDVSAADSARRYFHLSLRYALSGSAPRAFIFMGRIASGKSRLARRFGEETEIEIFSCDTVRKTLGGIPLTERTDEQKKKEIYSEDFSSRTYDAVLQSAWNTIRTGRSAVLDCTFSKKKYRDKVIHFFNSKNIPLLFIETVASENIMKDRLSKRAHKTDVISDARLEDYEKINASYETPLELKSEQYIQIDTSGGKDATFMELGKIIIQRNS